MSMSSHSSDPGRPSASDGLPNPQSRSSCRSVLAFFSLRLIRCGPRLLLYLAIIIVALAFLRWGFELRLPELSAVASAGGHLWPFRPGTASASASNPHRRPGKINNTHDALVGGGLRVVSFGENDVASLILPPDSGIGGLGGNGTSWTETLCYEISCSTYLNFAPLLDVPQISLTSNALYSGAMETVLKYYSGKLPAYNFGFLAEDYPVRWNAADLSSQVAAFLSQPRPAKPPRETVWVFSFGQWDIWSLSAFPYEVADGLIVALIGDIFYNVEKLFVAAQDPSSIAYSDYATNGSDSAMQFILPWDNASSAPFRIVLPFLLDPSVLPGWSSNRLAPPPLHTKPEQLRSAVRLTKRWNDALYKQMNAWVKKDLKQEEREKKKEAEKEEAKDGGNTDTKSKNQNGNTKATGDKSDQSINIKEGKNDKGKKPQLVNISSRIRKRVTKRDVSPKTPPALQRDAFPFRPAEYIMDMIIEGQMQHRGVADSKGFGRLSPERRFSEVDRPCVAMPPPPAQKSADVAFRARSDPTKEWPRPSIAFNNATHASNGTDDSICRNPAEHLFYTPFNLSPRAIGDLGRLSAALLKGNRTTRTALDRVQTYMQEMGRLPSSWEEYLKG